MVDMKRINRMLCDEAYDKIKYSISRGAISELNENAKNITELFNGIPESVLRILNTKEDFYHLLLCNKLNRTKLCEGYEKIKPDEIDMMAFNACDWLFLSDCELTTREEFYQQLPFVHAIDDNFDYYQDVISMINGMCRLGECFTHIDYVACEEDVTEYYDQIMIMLQGLDNEDDINKILSNNAEQNHFSDLNKVEIIRKEGWSVEYVRFLKDILSLSSEMNNFSYSFFQPDFDDDINDKYILRFSNQHKKKEEWFLLGCKGNFIEVVYACNYQEPSAEQIKVIFDWSNEVKMIVREDALEGGW